MFSADHLGLGNFSGNLSLEKTIFSSLGHYGWNRVLPHWCSHNSDVWVLLTQPYCWDFRDAATLSCLKMFHHCSSWTFLLQSSIPSSTMFSKPKVEGLCCWWASWDRAPCGQSFSVFWLVLNLSSNLYLLQKEACLVSGENYICLRGKV